ncbi:RNA 2'-phosphotransferase [Kitasatospora sp. NPDC002965]|uniref:RNA 2'-phosphotransferase n=1 Tax=Kitasatospora sp. NPDC002965 TaxID=3154775 RepID=UPI0033B961F7
MHTQRVIKTSRLLAHILRHRPGPLGITLDNAGWTGTDALLSALAAQGVALTRAELDHVVTVDTKRRFAYSEDGRSIRASQGHTVPVDLRLPTAAPPEVLFHGTAEGSVESILREGLRPMARHDVHLSPNPHTARQVGARRGRPVVLTVNTAAMTRAGHAFRVSANGVWLTDAVPPQFLART